MFLPVTKESGDLRILFNPTDSAVLCFIEDLVMLFDARFCFTASHNFLTGVDSTNKGVKESTTRLRGAGKIDGR